jgi:hypothetical protein
MKFFRIQIVLLLLSISLSAVDILVLHDNVGTEIDIIEKEHYGLFPDVQNFAEAQFFQLADGSVIARIKCWNDTGMQTKEIRYTEYEFYRLGQQIGRMAKPDNAKIEYLKHKYQPLFAEENVRQIPENARCEIYLYTKKTYHGYFFRLEDQKIQIQYQERFLDIPMNSVKKIRYWLERRELRFVRPLSIAGFSAAGLIGGQVAYSVLSAPVAYLWFYHSTGVIAGGTVGYKIAPLIAEKMQPKMVIEFRKNKIKRLDFIGGLTYTFKKLKGKICRKHGNRD